MNNRLAELESSISRSYKKNGAKPSARTRRPQGSKTGVSTSPPPASTPRLQTDAPPPVSKGLSRLVRRWPARSAGIAHALGRIDYSIPGVFGPIAQPKPMACWATAFTMMLSWRRQQSLTIEQTLGTLGQKWLDMFNGDKGLPAADTAAFFTAAGLVAEPPQSFSVAGWEHLLRTYGPILVTTDEAPGLPWAIHARIITAIKGDGSANKTCFTIVDPAGGRQYQESIATFIPKYQEEVIRSGYMRIQVVHWSADARAEVKSLSFGGRTTSPSRGPRAMAAPVVVPIVSSIVGASMTRILSNEGDVKWELDQMVGLKHVNDDRNTAGPAPYKYTAFTVNGPRASTTRLKDQIYVNTEIGFQHNGHSVGHVQTTIVGDNDAIAAGLDVKVNIMDDANAYTKPPGTDRFAAIKVRIHYRFSFTFYDDDYIWIDDIVLYGDGTHAFSRRKTQ